MSFVSFRQRSVSSIFVVGLFAAVGGLATSASATSSIRNAFLARYPGSTLAARTQTATGDVCILCHEPASRATAGNCYRRDLIARIAAGRTAAQAIVDIENVDSDGDGIPNGVEIMMARTDLPGQVGYNPGLIGATGTDPCSSNTTRAITGQRETPPPVCTADFNTDGVVDFFDYLDFVDAFAANRPSADFNGDTVIDFFDYLDFVDAFSVGC